MNQIFSTCPITCGFLMEKGYRIQDWTEIHAVIQLGNTNCCLSKCLFTTQLVDFRIKTCQDNTKGVKSCSCCFNFGSADTVHGSNDNFLSGYSKNWKSSAKSDDFIVLEFITMFPFQKKHNQTNKRKKMKWTWLVPKTSTLY